VAAVSPDIARRTFRTVEPCHALVYFCPEAGAAYSAIGLEGAQGYFASRSAPMGAVGAEVVTATFYNFNPSLVRAAMAGVWDRVSPSSVTAARLEAIDGGLRRSLGDAVGSPEMRRAADLARAAAEAACEHQEGRPLFAGHAGLEWPTEPHLVLWHAQTLLREFRGDAHVAALLLDRCSGLEALVVHAATGEVTVAMLQTTRAWPDDDWRDAVQALRERGWVADGDALTLTEEGTRRRAAVESLTDQLAVPAYAAIGEDGCEELWRLARPFSRTVVSSWTAPRPA
jgi:hypothetical protein